MSSSDQRENSNYQFLENISTEKLKSMIISDFLSGDTEDEANDEFMTQVLEVIARREEQDPSAPPFDVEAGWEKFEAEFFPAENPAPQKKTRQAERNTADSTIERQRAELQGPAGGGRRGGCDFSERNDGQCV